MSPRPIACGALLALPAAFASAQDVAAPPGRGWSIVREDLEIDIDPGAPRLTVSGTVRLRLDGADNSPGPTLALNARAPLMRFLRAGAGRRHPEHPATRLADVRLAEPKARGAEVDVPFACELAANGKQLAVTGEVALASWVEAWYPIPEPAGGVSLGAATRAAGRTRFRLPAGWSAVTNGRRVAREAAGGRVVEVWETERAVSRSFAAGPFRRVSHRAGGREVALYLLSDAARAPQQHVEALAGAIGAMEARFGPYPFAGYAVAEIPRTTGDFGASSEQGFIMVKPSFLRVPGGNLPLFAHEAAHAWWGNMVNVEGPGSILCSESLAQYGAVLAIEALEGEAAATRFLRDSRRGYVANQCARGYFALLRGGRDVPLARLQSGGVHHTLADSKGHWVYHMLRRRVGDEVFFATLRGLLDRFAGRAMGLDDLRAAFLRAAPDAGLATFFAQWLDRTGAPVLVPAWQARQGGAAVTVRQLQAGAPFDLRLEIGLALAGGRRALRTVHLDRRTQRFELAAPARVEEVELDPRHRLLLWDPAYGPVPGAPEPDDPELAAEVRARYLGEYHAADRDLTVRVVERGPARLAVVVGDRAPDPLRPVGEHVFRAADGALTFEVAGGVARALDYRGDDGRTARALR